MALLFLVLLSSAFDITVPFISQKLIDRLIAFFTGGGIAPISVLLWSAVGILVATVLARFLKSLYDYRLFKLVTTVEDQLRYRTYEKYLRLHSLFHHGVSSGQIIGRIDRGGVGMYAVLNDIIGHNLLPPLTVFLAVFAVLIYKNPLIGAVVFIPLPIYIFAVRKLTQRIYEIERRVNEQFDAVNKEEYDVAGNVLTVKKFAQEQVEIETQRKLRNKARQIQYEAEHLWAIMENIQTAIGTTGRIAVIILAGFLVVRGSATIGEFVLYITLQNMAYSPLAQLSNVLPRMRRNLGRSEKMFEILDEPVSVVDKPHAVALPPFAQHIDFQDMSFSYQGSGKKHRALRNIRLRIPAGTTVALVGRSGSGKTTFINLLLRSFDPTEGAILIDDYDLRDVTQDSLRSQMAVVPQEVDLFSRTIRENIAYGRPQVPDAELIRAAKTALAHDFIMKLEHGYDTVVGERGIKLSGGERQRIGIARAVLRDPRILILDEATSHLDSESERLIQKATKDLIKNRTSFIIAHRLSTVIHADLILVFKQGTIEAMGTHAELMKKSPTYQLLHDLQFQDA